MKGIIFNLLEAFLIEACGEPQFDEIMATCKLQTKGPFVGPVTYPDEDLLEIFSRAVAMLNLQAPDALRAFGKFCFPKLAGKYPQFLANHGTAKSFLLSVHSVIHVEVRKLYRDAVTPEFLYENQSPGNLIIKYRSKRNLCCFMEGLIEGTADHFKTPIDYRQSRCLLSGADCCEFHLTFGVLTPGTT